MTREADTIFLKIDVAKGSQEVGKKEAPSVLQPTSTMLEFHKQHAIRRLLLKDSEDLIARRPSTSFRRELKKAHAD